MLVVSSVIRVCNIKQLAPSTLAINAMSKILNYGAGLRDVAFELAAIIVLSILFFTVGIWIFKRRRMRAGA